MGFPVKHVANCLLQRDFEDGVPTISPMKLQKLVYCLHGWHLAIQDSPAIDSPFRAWQYGPVEEQLYHLFKGFGDRPITNYANTWVGGENKAYIVPISETKFYQVLDAVAKKYMPFTGLELSSLTHQPGTPWSDTVENGDEIIDNDVIKKHFRAIVKK